MNFTEYKKKKELENKQKEIEFEEKARQKINGMWSFFSFILSYKLKELLSLILFVNVSSSIAMIVEPKIAVWLHDLIANKINSLFQ